MSARLVVAVLAVFVLAPLPALADSTPIGPLPKGPVTAITAQRGQLVALALPKDPKLVWRYARPVKGTPVARQVSEGEVGNTVVVVWKITGRGQVTLAWALTKNDSSSKAFKARYFRIRGTQ